MTTPGRVIERFNQTGLALGAAARAAADEPLWLVTPVGGLARAELSPQNLLCAELTDAGLDLRWVLPVDLRRLRWRPTDATAEAVGQAFWTALETMLDELAGSEGVFWEVGSAVGRAPRGERGWTEYRLPRPWLDLGEFENGLCLVAPCSTGDARRVHPTLQAAVPGPAIEVTGGYLLRAVECVAELAHFAVLDPVEEGWTAAGALDPGVADDLRRAFLDYPQRNGGRVIV